MTDTHERLRRLREQQGLDLADLARRTGVRLRVFDAIERGAYDELPTGLYARHAVRTYAEALGCQPDSVLKEIAGRLPAAEDPLDGLARIHGWSRRTSLPDPDAPQAAETPVQPGWVPIASASWRPLAARAIDGGLLAVIHLILIWLTALAAAVEMATIVSAAMPALLFLSLIITVLYFVLLGGIGEATIGAAVMRLPRQDRSACAESFAGDALARGLRCALSASSILVEALVGTERGRHYLRALRIEQ